MGKKGGGGVGCGKEEKRGWGIKHKKKGWGKNVQRGGQWVNNKYGSKQNLYEFGGNKENFFTFAFKFRNIDGRIYRNQGGAGT